MTPRSCSSRVRSSESTGSVGSLLVHCLLEAGRRLPGRRRQSDEGRPLSPSGRLFVEEHQHAGHRRRLARARAAGDDREAPEHRRCRSQPLKVGLFLAREQPRQPRGEQLDVHAIGRRAREGQEIAGHLLFLRPVAVEVEHRPLQVERPIEARERAACNAGDPVVFVRPGELSQVGLLQVRGGRGADRGQIDTDVAESRRADGEGGTEQDGVVARVPEQPESRRDVHVGCRQDAGLVELAQHARGAASEADVVPVGLRQAHGSSRPRSNRSLRDATSDPDGRQDHTPHGWPSTSGRVGLLIPRRNK